MKVLARVLISVLVLTGLLLGLTASAAALEPSVLDQNKAIVRGATDAMNARRYSTLSDYFSPDLIDHDPYSGQAPGLPGFVQGMMILYSSFPNWVTTNDAMIADGDEIGTRWTSRGTQTSILMNLPPSGKKMELFGMRWYKLANGKIVETWVMLGLWRQIDQLPMQI
jgi:predicted ester cyclase